MAKKKLTNIKQDNLLLSSGRGKVLENYGFFKAKIKNSEDKKIKIKVLSSEIIETENSLREIAKIRIESTEKTGSRKIIQDSLTLSRSIENHTVSLPNMIDLNQNQNLNITSAIPSYSIDVGFNYVSQDYDNLQTSIDEYNLNSFIDNTSKDEILNFRKRKNSKIANFTRGTKMKNFVLPNKSAETLIESPYYIRTNINDGVKGDVSKFLQKIQIFDEVLNDYLNSPKVKMQVLSQTNTDTYPEDLQSYKLSSFFDSEIELDLDNFHGLNSNAVASKMSYDLRKHLFKGYLKKASTTGFRTFQDIYNGVECYKEAFAYSLEKFDRFDTEATRIQNLFIPSGYDNARFVDTQVKYGKTYFLKCKAHYMVVGNSYRYSNIRYFEEDGNTYATADVINEPNIVIIPMHIFSEHKTVIQPPPVHPQVSFVTENNSKNEIQFYFSPTLTDIEEEFISIIPSDVQQKKLMDNFFSTTNEKYKFQTYSQSGLFETFRLSFPPKSYSDFADAKLAETRMPFSSGNAILRDKVKPNEEYYYIFRQINQKGLVSNPTTVFKVRLVIDADDANVVVEEYKFPKKITSEDKTSFKSMVQIFPSVEQTIFDEFQDPLFEKTSAKGTINDLKLGIAKHKVWGRKIKFRFRSKTSGKIIDVNIDFKLVKNKTKEDF